MGRKQEVRALKGEASVERERKEETRGPHVFASLLRKTSFNKTDVKLSKGTFFIRTIPLCSSSGNCELSLTSFNTMFGFTPAPYRCHPGCRSNTWIPLASMIIANGINWRRVLVYGFEKRYFAQRHFAGWEWKNAWNKHECHGWVKFKCLECVRALREWSGCNWLFTQAKCGTRRSSVCCCWGVFFLTFLVK